MNLPFWFDDLALFYYMPENSIITIEQAYETHGITSTEISTCKAWWNTNLPMDHFVPTLIPCGEKELGTHICLMNFIERVKQRSEGKMCPSPPELKLNANIAILDKETNEVIGFIVNLPEFEKNDLKMFEFENNKHVLTGSFIRGEIIKRDLEHLYWDMIEGKYV